MPRPEPPLAPEPRPRPRKRRSDYGKRRYWNTPAHRAWVAVERALRARVLSGLDLDAMTPECRVCGMKRVNKIEGRGGTIVWHDEQIRLVDVAAVTVQPGVDQTMVVDSAAPLRYRGAMCSNCYGDWCDRAHLELMPCSLMSDERPPKWMRA